MNRRDVLGRGPAAGMVLVSAVMGGACSIIPFPRADAADAGPVLTDADGGAGEDAGMAAEDAGPPVRTIRQDTTAFGTTRVDNLLVDPLLTGLNSSSLSFFTIITDGQDIGGSFGVRQDIPTPAGTPAGRGIAFEETYRVIMAAPFQGGRGPFHVDVWACARARDGSTNGAERPDDVEVEVATLFPDDGTGTSWPLQVVMADMKIMGDFTWFHYVADIPDNLPISTALVIGSRRDGRDLYITAPQVLADTRPAMEARPAGVDARIQRSAEKRPLSAVTRGVLREMGRRAPRLDVPPHVIRERARQQMLRGAGPLPPPR